MSQEKNNNDSQSYYSHTGSGGRSVEGSGEESGEGMNYNDSQNQGMNSQENYNDSRSQEMSYNDSRSHEISYHGSQSQEMNDDDSRSQSMYSHPAGDDEGIADAGIADYPIPQGNYDQFDVESERTTDINQPPTAEEIQLEQEITQEQRIDNELQEDVTTRAALLTSPLLMAASSEVMLGDSSTLIPMSRETVSSGQKYSLVEKKHEEDFEEPDMEGSHFSDDQQDGRQYDQQFVPDGVIDNNMHESREEEGSIEKKTLDYKVIGMVAVAVVLCLLLGVVLISKSGGTERAAAPEFTPTFLPSRMPTTIPRSIAPVSAPAESEPVTTPGESVPVTAPVSVYKTSTPSSAPSSTPTTSPPSRKPTVILPSNEDPSIEPSRRSSDTKQPSILQISSHPSTIPTISSLAPSIMPIINSPRPTISESAEIPNAGQNVEPSASPSKPFVLASPDPTQSSFSDDELERREELRELFLVISGFIDLENRESPQFKASEWIMNDDPLRLSSSDRPEIIQRYVLATLYFATNGSEWEKCASPLGNTPCDNVMKRFLSGAPSCRWMGIICDANSSIESISIRRNRLDGILPPELGDLTRLTTLNLSKNFLKGKISNQLVQLRRLKSLLLNQNEFTGTVSTFLGQLRSIFRIHLGSNQLKGTIPIQVFAPTLQHFDLSDNQLTGKIPSGINFISKDLMNLDISSNKLTGLIPTIGKFSSLNTFAANNNTLTGTLPDNIMPKTLTTLDVGRNALTGTIPTSLYRLDSSPSFINLGFNSFDGTISSLFGNITSLETLVFFYNKLTGTIPSELSDLWNLEVLHFVGNSIRGSMPSEICQLREDSLTSLTSDCGGDTPMINCPCCTYCSSGE